MHAPIFYATAFSSLWRGLICGGPDHRARIFDLTGFVCDEQTEKADMFGVYFPMLLHATSYLEVMRVNVLVFDLLVRAIQHDK